MSINYSRTAFLLLTQNRKLVPFSCRGFKSAISLDKLYSSSSLDITKNVEPPSNEKEFSGYIPINALKITYMRSGAPGGQNVNKSASKVDIRFHLESSNWLPQSLKDAIKKDRPHLLTSSGELIVRSERTRVQHLNLADALDKLRNILYDAVSPPPPVPSDYIIEIQRRRLEKANRERLREKKMRSNEKKYRNPNTSHVL